MNWFLKVAVMSLASGTASGYLSIFLELTGNFQTWFMFGSCACFYSFAYAEFLRVIREWYQKQPPFRGWRFWIDKAFRRKENS